MTNVKEIFDCLSGNTGLTEEFIYYSLGKGNHADCRVLSSATEENRMLGFIPKNIILENNLKGFYETQGILVVRKGKAGKMIFLEKGDYTINDDAYILSLKKEFIEKAALDTIEKQKFFLKYFIYYHQHGVYEYATNSDNGTWNKTAFFQYYSIDMQSMDEIYNLVMRYEKCVTLKKKIYKINNAIKELENKHISLKDQGEKQIPLNRIFSYISRNDSLSQEGLYRMQPKSEDIITVLSGSTDNIVYGKIDEHTPKIHYLKERQCLHVITRGKAGKLTFVKKGTYATNTNAFLLYIEKDRWEELNIHNEKEEEMYLKYLLLYLQPIFYEECSRADVAVFPLTEVMQKLYLFEMKYNQSMLKLVELYDKLNYLKMNVKNIFAELEVLENKAIIL